MYLIAICAVGLAILIFGIIRMKQLRDRRELEKYSIEPEELHALLEAKKDIVVLDVRQPTRRLFPERREFRRKR